MSINSILPDDIEYFSLELTPSRTFSSSSLSGSTGSIYVFPRHSPFEKEVYSHSPFSQSHFTDSNINDYLTDILTLSTGSSNINAKTADYLNIVHQQSASLRKKQQVTIFRYTPSVDIDSNFLAKGVITNQLMSYYRNIYPSAHFGYTNYHSLNFFTGSNVPTSSAILYPNTSSATYPLGVYSPSGAFSFDFWINPRYRGEARAVFQAGTLLHLSSCYAVSLVTGSRKDKDGYPDGFRIQLQLSHSADISPSLAVETGSYPNNLVFLSKDNSLSWNHWHKVTIRWGTNGYNLGTGSFYVDGTPQGTFVIPSASVQPQSFVGKSNPGTLVVGNYYVGTNTGTTAQTLFFQTSVATRDGLIQLDTGTNEVPVSWSLNQPLNAEVHDIKIYNKYLSDTLVSGVLSNSFGPTSLDGLIFYLPPFFTKESPTRKFVGDHGGIPITPFQEADGTTINPFSTKLSYGVNGHYINLENFTKDFAQGLFPRLFLLTQSVAQSSVLIPITANDYYYQTGSNIKRNVTILPCDNGLFSPNFNFLQNGNSPILDPNINSGLLTYSASTVSFVNDLGASSLGSISLRNLVPSSSYWSGFVAPTGSIAGTIMGPAPDNLSGSVSGSSFLTILQRTRDNSSNAVVIFDISNLFYGKKIKEGTFVITDTSITGTAGKVGITIKDDGFGNLFRADTLTPCATFNSVGNIFYSEGLVFIKSPHLFFFGKDQFSLSFKGLQDIHTTTYNILLRSNQIVSSSNPTYHPMSASNNANDYDKRFVLINQVLLHDQDLNVVLRSQMSQPILKKTKDKILIKVKMTY